MADSSESSSSSSSSNTVDTTNDEPIGFSDIGAEQCPTEIESLCVNCGENGVTRMLLTRIPHFREIILMAFECPHCDFRNNEVQFGGSYQLKGRRFQVKLTEPKDLNRQVVKSDTGRFVVPSIDFEVPAMAQRGQLNTVEGVFARAIDGLSEGQPVRRITEPEVAEKIDAFIKVLEAHKSGAALPFDIVIDDPAGNSFIENPHVPAADPHMEIVEYVRTREQDIALGLLAPELRTDIQHTVNTSGASSSNSITTDILSDTEAAKQFTKAEDEEKEILTLPGTCSSCHEPGEVRMVVTEIPHFKEIVLMAFTCDHCGFKSNEVKSGGAIPDHGTRIAIRLENFPLDLNRDLLKSQTAGLEIPELELELSPGTLGGKFTTVEGMLQSVKDQLQATNFASGDSLGNDSRSRIKVFLDELDTYIAGQKPFTLVIDDPLSNSYVQNVFAPDEDPNMAILTYTRSHEQDEALGLLDMRTEDY